MTHISMTAYQTPGRPVTDKQTLSYHRIAKACLKALNAYTHTKKLDPKEAVQDAHAAIAEAFSQEILPIEEEKQQLIQGLRLIASASAEVNAQHLRQMAQSLLDQSGNL